MKKTGTPIYVKGHDLIDLLPPLMKKAVDIIPRDFFLCTTKELDEHANPSEQERLLKASFWLQITKLVGKPGSKPICLKDIYFGISHPNLLEKMLRNYYKTAWFFTPTAINDATFQVLYEKSIRKLEEALSAKCIIDKKLHVPTAKLHLEIFDRLTAIKNGPQVHRIEHKQLNVNVTKKEEELSPETVEDLDKQIEDLKKKATYVKDEIVDHRSEEKGTTTTST